MQHTRHQTWLLLALAAGVTTGCMRADAEQTTDEAARTWSGDYPPIDPAEKYMEPGPILATPEAVELASRFAYHQAVIDAHDFSYTIRDNPAMHLGVEMLTGLVIPADTGDGKAKPLPAANLVTLPPSWDWRAQGAGLPPPRNQGSCGSCWAFGTIAVVEAAIAVSDKQIVDLSEQEVLDCSGMGTCGGGFWAYHKLPTKGAALEQSYKYTGYDGSCKSGSVAHPYTIESYHGLPDGDIDAIKAAVFQYGAVGVTMAVCGSFPGYAGGIYDSTECNWSGSNHIVAIVGWDDTVAHKRGHGAWIVRNSWGTSWGDQGYVRMAYGTAGIEGNGTYVIYKPEDPTDTDGDGVRDVHDNCKTDANAGQEDADQDAIGDACDAAFDPFEKAIALSDDDSRKVELGFAFPFFGATYTSVHVNADGNLTFGAADGKATDRSKARFLTFAPRIAALYADLNPAQGGKVTYGKATEDSLFVTYAAVPLYGAGGANTVTVTLDATGDVKVAVGAVSGKSFIVGLSKGTAGNAAGESDLSAAAGAIGYAGATAVYEVFAGGEAFDLAGKTLTFTTGEGTDPLPGGETVLPLGDDATVAVALPFGFPFFGATYSSVYVNSDGNLTFGAGDGETANRSTARFLTGAPRIAVLYGDLDPSKGGQVSHRSDGAESITIAYAGVPVWGGSQGNTASVTLDASGGVTIDVGVVASASTIVGVSKGGAANQAAESDLSASVGQALTCGEKGAIFEDFAGNAFDLAGKQLVFVP